MEAEFYTTDKKTILINPESVTSLEYPAGHENGKIKIWMGDTFVEVHGSVYETKRKLSGSGYPETIQSHRAANDNLGGEADLLAGFMAADGIPDELPGGWVKVGEGAKKLDADDVYETSFICYERSEPVSDADIDAAFNVL